jgi:hypothetical protein
MIGDLSKVRARLEIAVALNPDKPATAEEEYLHFESTAAAILDSEFEDWEFKILENYLTALCKVRMMELGLTPDLLA